MTRYIYSFSIKRTLVNFLISFSGTIFGLYLFFSIFIPMFPPIGQGTPTVRVFVPILIIYGLYGNYISVPRLFHRGPAVTIDEEGIWAYPWNGGRKMAWHDIGLAGFENWGRFSLSRRKIGYVVLRSHQGGKIKIGSNEFRRRDWEEIYRLVREALPPPVRENFPPLENESPSE